MNMAAPPQNHPATPTLTNDLASDKHCIFRFSESWFAVPAMSVVEITVAPPIAKVPASHRFLEGLCHLRSEFIPVIALSQVMGMNNTQTPDDALQLMLFAGKRRSAIRVSEVPALQSIETFVTQDGKEDIGDANPCIGTANFRDMIIRVLDPNTLQARVAHSLETQWRQIAGTTANTSSNV